MLVGEYIEIEFKLKNESNFEWDRICLVDKHNQLVVNKELRLRRNDRLKFSVGITAPLKDG